MIRPAASSYPAALYASLHRGTPGDLAFYRRECAGSSSVLELGCGFGRVLAALTDVVPARWGLDAHPGLLALARAATDAVFVEASMQDFELGRAFDRVLIPYNGLYCLLTDDDVQACLRQARGHLTPGGRLIVDVYPYDGPPEGVDSTNDQFDPLVLLEAEGVAYTVYEAFAFDPASEVAAVTYRYVSDLGAAHIDGVIEQRALTETALASHLAAAGFSVVRWHGGFEGEPLDEDAEQWTIVAEVGSGDGEEGSVKR